MVNREYKVSFDKVYQARLWERALTSGGVLKAQLGKLDIKRYKPGIPFISLPIVSLFKLAIMK